MCASMMQFLATLSQVTWLFVQATEKETHRAGLSGVTDLRVRMESDFSDTFIYPDSRWLYHAAANWTNIRLESDSDAEVIKYNEVQLL